MANPVLTPADWAEVCKTAIAIGSVSDAARQHGVTIAAATQRAKRENWPTGRRPWKEAQKAQDNARLSVKASNPTAVINVISTSEALQNTLSDDRNATKMAASRTARRAFEDCDTLEPSQIRSEAAKLRDLVTVAEKSQDWASNQQAVTVNVFHGEQPADAIEI